MLDRAYMDGRSVNPGTTLVYPRSLDVVLQLYLEHESMIEREYLI